MVEQRGLVCISLSMHPTIKLLVVLRIRRGQKADYHIYLSLYIDAWIVRRMVETSDEREISSSAEGTAAERIRDSQLAWRSKEKKTKDSLRPATHLIKDHSSQAVGCSKKRERTTI